MTYQDWWDSLSERQRAWHEAWKKVYLSHARYNIPYNHKGPTTERPES